MCVDISGSPETIDFFLIDVDRFLRTTLLHRRKNPDRPQSTSVAELDPQSEVAGVRLQHVGIVIPTYNAAGHWQALRAGLDRQGLRAGQILIVDSSSSDETRTLARQSGYQLIRIPKSEFGHGCTRQAACEYLPWAEFLLFMTQDAVLSNSNSVERLCHAMEDETVGVAYGRQIPRPEADAIERHGRLFNYPARSQVRTLDSRRQLGFKAAFCSNSFAVYRRRALDEVGGFPKNTIVSEEVTVAARMLLAGWKTVYQADAIVIHSHRLTLRKEFSRYFDIGVHHGRERWLLEVFGNAGNEGLHFVKSELGFLWSTEPDLIPVSLLRTASKLIAYKLGVHEAMLPLYLKRLLSAHAEFWSPKPALKLK